MAGEYRLTGLAVPESLDQLHLLLDAVRRDHPELEPDDLMMFETAIIEVHGNVVQHGRPEGQVVYVFELAVLPDRLEGFLATTGEAAPDLSHVTELVDELAESGRGMWLARAALDDLAYARSGDRNTWRMVKLRHEAPAG
jgi:serine/threonine-protein kinase RsbW